MSTAIVTVIVCLAAFMEKASTAADIRLAGGNSPAAGRLEVLVDGQWGTVCDTHISFTKTEADVACQQLGFGQASNYGSDSQFRANVDLSLPVVMVDVSCSASPTRLQECTFSTNSIRCSSIDNQAVTCSNCSMYLCNNQECVDGELCDGTTDCADGSDEDEFTCELIGAIGNVLSTTLRIVIAVVVVVFVLLIGVPVAICICVCICTGACVCCATSKRRGGSAPDNVHLEKI